MAPRPKTVDALRDRLEKARALMESPNVHEAERARELVAELERRLPAPPVSTGAGDAAAYPHQLPAAIRVPSSLKGGA